MLIKVAGVRNSKCNRSAWAYEAEDLHGVIKLYGVASNNANLTNGAVQEALIEAVITAKNYGFHRILLLTNNKNLVQLLHRFKNPAWHERSLITDMEIFYQSGLVCNLLVVPKCVLDFVYVAAKLAIHKLCIFLSFYKKKKKKLCSIFLDRVISGGSYWHINIIPMVQQNNHLLYT